MFCKRGVLINFPKFTGKHLCQSIFFNKVADLNFIKKETLTQVFSCEFCEISKNIFSYRAPLMAASVVSCDLFLFYLAFHVSLVEFLEDIKVLKLTRFESSAKSYSKT